MNAPGDLHSVLTRPDARLAVKRKPAIVGAGIKRLRGKDSNLDYLIQSQASYH
jgi:hypothetical protein